MPRYLARDYLRDYEQSRKGNCSPLRKSFNESFLFESRKRKPDLRKSSKIFNTCSDHANFKPSLADYPVNAMKKAIMNRTVVDYEELSHGDFENVSLPPSASDLSDAQARDDCWNFQLHYPCQEVSMVRPSQKNAINSTVTRTKNPKGYFKSKCKRSDRYSELNLSLGRSEIEDDHFVSVETAERCKGLHHSNIKNIWNEGVLSNNTSVVYHMQDINECFVQTDDVTKKVCSSEADQKNERANIMLDEIWLSSSEDDFVIVDSIEETDSGPRNDYSNGVEATDAVKEMQHSDIFSAQRYSSESNNAVIAHSLKVNATEDLTHCTSENETSKTDVLSKSETFNEEEIAKRTFFIKENEDNYLREKTFISIYAEQEGSGSNHDDTDSKEQDEEDANNDRKIKNATVEFSPKKVEKMLKGDPDDDDDPLSEDLTHSSHQHSSVNNETNKLVPSTHKDIATKTAVMKSIDGSQVYDDNLEKETNVLPSGSEVTQQNNADSIESDCCHTLAWDAYETLVSVKVIDMDADAHGLRKNDVDGHDETRGDESQVHCVRIVCDEKQVDDDSDGDNLFVDVPVSKDTSDCKADQCEDDLNVSMSENKLLEFDSQSRSKLEEHAERRKDIGTAFDEKQLDDLIDTKTYNSDGDNFSISKEASDCKMSAHHCMDDVNASTGKDADIALDFKSGNTLQENTSANEQDLVASEAQVRPDGHCESEGRDEDADKCGFPMTPLSSSSSSSPMVVTVIREVVSYDGEEEPSVGLKMDEADDEHFEDEIPLDLSARSVVAIKLNERTSQEHERSERNCKRNRIVQAATFSSQIVTSDSLVVAEDLSTGRTASLSSSQMPPTEYSREPSGKSVAPSTNSFAASEVKRPPYSNELLTETKEIPAGSAIPPSMRLVRIEDDFDPVERFFSIRKSSRTSQAETTSASLPSALPVVASGETSVRNAVGALPAGSLQEAGNNKAAVSCSGNVAVVPPRCNTESDKAKELPFISHTLESSDIVEQSNLSVNVLSVPLTEDYARLAVALGNEAGPSMALLKDHHVLKADQKIEDLTPDASRFIAKQLDKCNRSGNAESADVLRAAAILHLIVSALNSLVNCCLLTSANQLGVMVERNRIIIGDHLNSAVGCLTEMSSKYKETATLHPKVLKLSKILGEYLYERALFRQQCQDHRGTIVVVEADYATSLGTYLCECISSLHKELQVNILIPAVSNDLNASAEQLIASLSPKSVIISTCAVVPVLKFLMRGSSVCFLLVEYSHSGRISFDPETTSRSKIICISLQSQPVGGEYESLSLRDVLIAQNNYTFITSQEFVKLPDVLFSLESCYKITLVERSYSDMTLNINYCDVLVDHENGLLVKDISFLTNDEAVERLLILIMRLSSNLSRCWVVFYNFNNSVITSNLASNYYNLVAIGTMVSSKRSEYEIKFLCCNSLDSLPRLIRQIGDFVYKSNREHSKNNGIMTNANFITADPTRHEMVLLAFPCFNSMSAQLLLRSKSLVSLMSTPLDELLKDYPMISSKNLQMFTEFRQSTSQMYKQLKQDDGYLCHAAPVDVLGDDGRYLTSTPLHDGQPFGLHGRGDTPSAAVRLSKPLQFGGDSRDVFSRRPDTPNRWDYDDRYFPDLGQNRRSDKTSLSLYREDDYAGRQFYPETSGRREVEAGQNGFDNFSGVSSYRTDAKFEPLEFEWLRETEGDGRRDKQFGRSYGYSTDFLGDEAFENWNRFMSKDLENPSQSLSNMFRMPSGSERIPAEYDRPLPGIAGDYDWLTDHR